MAPRLLLRVGSGFLCPQATGSCLPTQHACPVFSPSPACLCLTTGAAAMPAPLPAGKADLVAAVRAMHNVLGGTIDPHASYLLLRGMKVRGRHSQSRAAGTP